MTQEDKTGHLIPMPRRPDIKFHRDGRIEITARLAQQLELSPGDSINISAEPDGELYIFVQARAAQTFGRRHAVCYPTNRRSKNYRANSVSLCRKVLDLARTENREAAFFTGYPIGIDRDQVIPIIYKNPIINNNNNQKR